MMPTVQIQSPNPEVPELDFSSDIPLLVQVADFYRERIKSKDLVEGTRLPSCLELSIPTSLAPQTINRAFDMLAKENLVYRRRSLGTIVGNPGSVTSTQHTPRRARKKHAALPPPISMVLRKEIRQEGLFSGDDSKLRLAEFLDGLMTGFASLNQRFELAYVQSEGSIEEMFRRLVESGQTRGFVLFHIAENEAIDYLTGLNFPAVSLNLDLTERGAPSVIADHVQGYREAWQYVSSLGHKNVGFVGLKVSGDNTRFRECAAGRELAGVEASFGQVWLTDDSDRGISAQRSSERIWETFNKIYGPRQNGRWPSLLFAQNDFIATLLIRAFQSHLRIPDDISIIGFDDTSTGRGFNPAITTLSKPRTKMGESAAQLLHDLLSKSLRTHAPLQVLPVGLIKRETVAAMPGFPLFN